MSNITFRGNPALKEEALIRAREHRQEDDLRHGHYAMARKLRGKEVKFTGCAVGCLSMPIGIVDKRGAVKRIEEQDVHALLEQRLGIPEVLGRLADSIFEEHESGPRDEYGSRPNRAARVWPEQFVAMIPVGLDIEGIELELYELLDEDGVTSRKRKLAKLLASTADEQGIEPELREPISLASA